MPGELASFKVAVKVPVCGQAVSLSGAVLISMQGFEPSKIQCPIRACVVIPKIECGK